MKTAQFIVALVVAVGIISFAAGQASQAPQAPLTGQAGAVVGNDNDLQLALGGARDRLGKTVWVDGDFENYGLTGAFRTITMKHADTSAAAMAACIVCYDPTDAFQDHRPNAITRSFPTRSTVVACTNNGANASTLTPASGALKNASVSVAGFHYATCFGFTVATDSSRIGATARTVERTSPIR